VKRAVLIGVAGGTGSGKTTVAKRLLRSFPDKSILYLEQDAYYKEQSGLSFEERAKTNYDHPLAFDTDLLLLHLQKLLNYEPIDKPIYDYVIHNRKEETKRVLPKDVIILEGILVLEDKRLRDLMDIKLFVDTDADVRFIRRLIRDIRDRGRTMESVIEQYLTTVRPMHLEFVEQTKRYADIIIPEGGKNQVAIDLLITKIKAILQEQETDKIINNI